MDGKTTKQSNSESESVRPAACTNAPNISRKIKVTRRKRNPCRETSLDFIEKLNHEPGCFQELPTPIKSPEDQKQYKVIRLANGLTACLISDSSALYNDEEEKDEEVEWPNVEPVYEYETVECEASKDESHDDCPVADLQKAPRQKMAAAALCVDVGSFSDPKDIPGLAHFLEHLLFMGSEKFPEENDLRKFFSIRSGFINACTCRETTNFYFECLNRHMYQALDRLAQIFISPLILRDTITREREAVDYEFQEALPKNSLRQEQLLMDLAKRDSPVSSFLYGNLETLRDNIQDSELHEAVHEFRKRHYSAHRMTLVVQAGLPIELLEAYVSDCFSDVPCNDKPPLDFTMFRDCYDTPEWNRIYFVEPTTDVDRVEVTFVLPSLLYKYKTKPHRYVSDILNDEGKGSLITYLRKKTWVVDVTGDTECGSTYTFFSIYMHLTAEGVQNLYTILELLFSFINMLKTVGPQESIYNEMKEIQANAFRFTAEQSAFDNVVKLADDMHIFPSEDYLTGPKLFYEYDPEGIKMVLDHLVPRKANIVVMTKNHLTLVPPVRYDKKEKWFGTKYTDVAITEERLLRWEQARPLDEFALPLPNQFLTTNFDMLPLSSDDTHSEVPVKILQTDGMEVWHHKDEKFGLPKAIWYISFAVPSDQWITTKQEKMFDFYVRLMEIQIAEEVWPARNAYLSIKLMECPNGMTIKVSGFNEKLPILIDLLLKHMKAFASNLTKETFEAVRDNATREFHNNLLNPRELAKYCESRTKEHYELKVIPEVTFEDMKTFAEGLLEFTYVRILVQGNVSAEQALLVAQNVVRYLNYKPFESDYHPETSILPLDRSICRVSSLNKSDPNSAVVKFYQADKYDTNTYWILKMIVLFISEPLFDTLRTKEQLGYTVDCSVRDTNGTLGLSVTVITSADKYTVCHVDERIEAFMKQTLYLLRNIGFPEFVNAKCNRITELQCCENNLGEEAARNWGEITANRFAFDRRRENEERIEVLWPSDLIIWWEKHIWCDSPNKCTPSMTCTQVVGHGSRETSSQKSD